MEEAWTARDVYLLTGGADGTVAVPQLALTLLPGGIELDKPDGEIVWSCTWPELHELSPVERSVLPDGSDGVVVEVVEKGRRGRRHRFVLPTDDPVAVEELLRRRARDHGLHTASAHAPVSRLLTALIALATVATLTLLLLSAAHVLHF
jgi:hypothetical protein